MEKTGLPNGFITVDEAVKLIESDKFDDAKVDTQWLVSHIDWIERGKNFRIPLMKHSEDKKKVVGIGEKYVFVDDNFNVEFLKRTIRNHYKSIVGRDFEKRNTRAVSTVSDDKTGGKINPRVTKSIADEGESLGSSNNKVSTAIASGAGV